MDRAVVRSIVDLGHHLGCPVTAGGIEDRAALDDLGGVGGDHAYIYFIAKPMRSDALDQFIDENVCPCCREANA
jgi:EAL domain-containing protein (putative c-di-GMP-specific phosphodiesterase class I)